MDKLNLSEYNTVGSAETIGIELQNKTLVLCYTQKSASSGNLIAQCTKFKLDHPFKSISFLGDFNVHNPGWFCSIGNQNAGGLQAEEMCQMFGLNQLIDFPTRGLNTLDLVMSPLSGNSTA